MPPRRTHDDLLRDGDTDTCADGRAHRLGLRERDFHAAFAAIALPNPASIALHRTAGFSRIGVFEEVGFKFDAWHDVSWWRRGL